MNYEPQSHTPSYAQHAAVHDPRVSPVNGPIQLRVSWGAIFAGVVLALVVQLIINLLGVGAGAATLDPATSDNPSAAALSYGAAAWFVAAGVIASLVGGYAAGRLSGSTIKSTAGWHGITTWAATTLVIFYLLIGAVGSAVGGASTLLGGALGGLASSVGGATQTAVEAVAPRVQDPFAAIEQAVRGATNGSDPAALRDAAVTALRAVVTGDEAQAEAAREQAAQALAAARGEPIETARTQVQQFEEQYRQTVETARQQATAAADVAAKVTSRGSLVAVISLLFGAVAAAFGGRLGAARRIA